MFEFPGFMDTPQKDTFKSERDVGLEPAAATMAWDIKITPEGRGYLIEYQGEGLQARGGMLGSYGLNKVYEDFEFQPEPSPGYEESETSFHNFWQNVNNKNITHEIMDVRTPELLEPENVENPEQKIVVKPVAGSNGWHVSVKYADEISRRYRFDDLDLEPVADSMEEFRELHGKDIFEEFIPSKAIEINGDTYDGCMRYLTRSKLEETGDLTVNHVGGYWRGASEPRDSEAPLNHRFIANGSEENVAPAAVEDLAEARSVVNDSIESAHNYFLRREEEGSVNWKEEFK